MKKNSSFEKAKRKETIAKELGVKTSNIHTIIHVEFKDKHLQKTIDNKEGKHFYFGTLTAVFVRFSSDQIGYAKKTIAKRWEDTTETFDTGKCLIRKSFIISKPANRKQPIKILRVQ